MYYVNQFVVNLLPVGVVIIGTERGKKVKCELTLSGCKYVGIGISKSKKSAKKKATEDYVSFLARQHLLSTPKVFKKKLTILYLHQKKLKKENLKPL